MQRALSRSPGTTKGTKEDIPSYVQRAAFGLLKAAKGTFISLVSVLLVTKSIAATRLRGIDTKVGTKALPPSFRAGLAFFETRFIIHLGVSVRYARFHGGNIGNSCQYTF